LKVIVKREVLEALLEVASRVYPREMLTLLRGRKRKDVVEIYEVLIAPLSTHGLDSAHFRLDLLPLDFTIVGLAHSHPSGDPRPSIEDLHNFIGLVMLILTPPYKTSRDVHAYNSSGDHLDLEVKD